MNQPPPTPRTDPETEEAASPTLGDVLGRSAIPLLLLAILAGTPLWGGVGTLVLAFAAWRAAGVLL